MLRPTGPRLCCRCSVRGFGVSEAESSYRSTEGRERQSRPSLSAGLPGLQRYVSRRSMSLVLSAIARTLGLDQTRLPNANTPPILVGARASDWLIRPDVIRLAESRASRASDRRRRNTTLRQEAQRDLAIGRVLAEADRVLSDYWVERW